MKNKEVFFKGIKDGIPIALGYFAVAFSLGINAKKAGLNPFQGFIASLTTKASAGEFAGYTVIAADAAYIEMILVILVANARYFLMSCSMSQRLAPDMKFIHRLGLGWCITDEVFAISIAQEGCINPLYPYGAITIASLCWALGTACGIIAGNLMPAMAVSALSVSLYGMFLAVIIPPSREDKKIAVVVACSFALSFAASKMKFLDSLSGGMKTIILTILISTLAALFFPKKEDAVEEEAAQ